MTSPYISKVSIKNFRNFKNCEISLSKQHVFIGENESGKTNLLFAIQLILDPSFSDEDRQLGESDFNDALAEAEKDEIEISVFISEYENNQTLLAQLYDATVSITGENFLKLTYKLTRTKKDDGSISYEYKIYKGDDANLQFSFKDRKYLQFKVIKPIRDVEYELRNFRNSPLLKLLNEYDIAPETLKSIADEIQTASEKALSIDEIINASQRIEKSLQCTAGLQYDLSTSFSMADVAQDKILNALRLVVGGKQLQDKSLGVKNLIYISIILLLLRRESIPSLIGQREFARITESDTSKILVSNYTKTAGGNYKLNENNNTAALMAFWDERQKIGASTLIVAIEEPEAHLHPILQRLVFKDLFNRANESILLTTHSTIIASITPIEKITHVLKSNLGCSNLRSLSTLQLSDGMRRDIQRYIDVRRGEIYFGRGAIFVEGIAEEYLIPKFAELLGDPLDKHGIVVCNVNSTNFNPYLQLAQEIGIPYIVITDGDFYYENSDQSRQYHCLYSTTETRKYGYLGLELFLDSLALLEREKALKLSGDKLTEFVRDKNYYIGTYTFEVDIMLTSRSSPGAVSKITSAYNRISRGGELQKTNFKKELESGECFKCLAKIEERGVGKGRFSQVLSQECEKDNVPEYINEAIKKIIKLTNHE